MAFLGRTFFHCAHKPDAPVKHTELLTSCRLRFLEISQILILKVTLALCVMEAALFDAFARHALNLTVDSIYLNIFVSGTPERA